MLVVAALVVAAAAPVGALVTTSHGAASGSATAVSGEVYAGGNVAGATVTMVGADGSSLPGPPKTRTLVGGAFALSVRDLPADFRIVVRGGRVGGHPLAGVLMADVRGFEPEAAELVSVNPGTTLVSAYLDQHPRASLTRANATVSKFLGLPSPVDLADMTSLSTADFDQARFLAEAAHAGGLTSFVAALVRQMDAGKRHRFTSVKTTSAKVGEPSPTDIAAFLFEALRANSNRPECLRTPPAASCKDIPFGDVLRFFTSNTEKALAEITAKLDLVLEQLKQLQATADTIVGRLDQLTYDSVVGFMNPDAINRAMTTFKEVTENCAVTQKNLFCENQLGDSTAANPGQLRIAIRSSLINNGVIDGVWKRVSGRTLGQTTSGILDVVPTVVTLDASRKPVTFFTKERSKAMLATIAYFQDVEMTAIALATNYWRWEGRPEKSIVGDINVFDSQVKLQKQVYSPLPDGTVLDLRTGLMWSTSVFCGTYSSFGPRETGQCPAKYAGFPVTDQRLIFPGYPYLPYFTECTNGSWCMGTEAGIGKLVEGASQPWGTWLHNQAGITFGKPGEFDTWLSDVDCSVWRIVDHRPLCDAERRFVNWQQSNVQWSATKDRNTAWYLFVRRPTEAARYH